MTSGFESREDQRCQGWVELFFQIVPATWYNALITGRRCSRTRRISAVILMMYVSLKRLIVYRFMHIV